MGRLNYHHLQYFWAVAKEGNLTRAAAQMHVSQSALSAQIRQLEEQLGQDLFERRGRTLELTEAGRVALGYAEQIFGAGQELFALLKDGHRERRQRLRVGAVATLSRNFVDNWLRPLLAREDVELVLVSGGFEDLLARLRVHALDLVLSNRAAVASADDPWRCQRLARQPVSLVGRPRPAGRRFRFPADLATQPLLLPGRDSDIRQAFDGLCEQLGVRYRVRAEVDDMALLRLLARDAEGTVALLPTVVVQDELAAGTLVELAQVPGIAESFYAVSLQRRWEPPLVQALLARRDAEVLGGPREPRA